VHQLVRSEHPDLVSIPRAGFIQIMKYDEKREEGLKRQRTEVFKEKVARQVGLRWVVEGMCGGSLDNINPIMFAKGIEGKPVWIDLKELKRAHEEVKESLKKKRTVLVGHNLFMDLINFYKCFFGPLPDTVEDFQAIIHELFPLIIDTKYVATHYNTDPNPRSGLDELDADYGKNPVPIIGKLYLELVRRHALTSYLELHPEHLNYKGMAYAHEAGYDSFTTAKVLIRLAAKLEAAGHYVTKEYIQSESGGWHTPPESAGALIDFGSESQHGESSTKEHGLKSDQSISQGARLAEVTNLAPTAATILPAKKPKKPKKPKKEAQKPYSAFAHAGRFDLLGESNMDGANDGVDVEDMKPDDENTPLQEAAPQPDIWDLPAPPVKETVGTSDKPVSKFMPDWESVFWNVYGNKLRVYGTVEEMCDLMSGAPRPRKVYEVLVRS